MAQLQNLRDNTPLPILKAVLAGRELPLGVAQKPIVQRGTLQHHHRAVLPGNDRSGRTPTETITQIRLLQEYKSHASSCPMQDAPPFDSSNTLGVWFTDRSTHLKNGVWFGKSTAISADGKAELIEEIKGSAQ